MRKLKSKGRYCKLSWTRRYFFRGIQNRARFWPILVGAPTQREAHMRPKHQDRQLHTESHAFSTRKWCSASDLLSDAPPSSLLSFWPKRHGHVPSSTWWLSHHNHGWCGLSRRSPTQYNITMAHARIEGFDGFFLNSLTQLGTNLEQVHKRSN
jgi:hypothetical protein